MVNKLAEFAKDVIKRLGVVDMINEGQNIPELDWALIVGFNSNPRDMTQRIGRMLRKREGYKARIIIICTEGTKDVEWLEAALTGMDPAKIIYDSWRNYR